MATQVFRIETRANFQRGIVHHVQGKHRPDNAKTPPLGTEPVEILGGDVAAARKALAAHRRRIKRAQPGKRGRRADGAIEAIFQGPAYDRNDREKSLARIRAWARDCDRWYRRSAPASVVAVSALHFDERSPHLHILATAQGTSGGLGKAYVRADIAGVELPYDPTAIRRPSYAETSAEGTAMQDRLFEAVSRRYELGRGEKGSKRRHREIDRARALDDREAELDERERIQTVIEQSIVRQLDRIPRFVARAVRAIKRMFTPRLDRLTDLTARLDATAAQVSDVAAAQADGFRRGYALGVDVEAEAAARGASTPIDPWDAHDWLEGLDARGAEDGAAPAP